MAMSAMSKILLLNGKALVKYHDSSINIFKFAFSLLAYLVGC